MHIWNFQWVTGDTLTSTSTHTLGVFLKHEPWSVWIKECRELPCWCNYQEVYAKEKKVFPNCSAGVNCMGGRLRYQWILSVASLSTSSVSCLLTQCWYTWIFNNYLSILLVSWKLQIFFFLHPVSLILTAFHCLPSEAFSRLDESHIFFSSPSIWFHREPFLAATLQIVSCTMLFKISTMFNECCKINWPMCTLLGFWR